MAGNRIEQLKEWWLKRKARKLLLKNDYCPIHFTKNISWVDNPDCSHKSKVYQGLKCRICHREKTIDKYKSEEDKVIEAINLLKPKEEQWQNLK